MSNTVLVDDVKYGVDRATVRKLANDLEDMRAGLLFMLQNWTSPALRATDIDRLWALAEKS